jgi:hypothetical protein
MPVALWSRRLQFSAGPESHEFYACAEGKAALERGEAGSGLFFATADEPLREVDPNDEIECDCCREG